MDEPGNFHCPAASYPPVSEVRALRFESFPDWVGRDLRAKSAAAEYERHARELESDARRYEEIRERGAEALSAFDRTIASSSDAAALRMALSLKFNHVTYHMKHMQYIECHWPGVVPFCLAHLAEENTAADLIAARPAQLSLF